MKSPLPAATVVVCCALSVTTFVTAPTVGSALASQPAAVISIWRLPAPLAADASVQPLEAGVVAVNFLAPEFAALARHPGATATIAVDPLFVSALERQAAGASVLTGIASGEIGADDARMTQVLGVLARDVVPSSDVAATPVGKRFVSDAAAANLALAGNSAAHFSHTDDVDFAAAALLVSLASSGDAGANAPLLKKNTLTTRDLATLAAAFARTCRSVVDTAKRIAAAGTLEVAALPAYEPIMPLVINAAGRRVGTPFTVDLGAAVDVSAAVDEGLRMAHSLAPNQGAAGVLSPSGAYNDETAALLEERRAAYGIFSERVVKANAGASAASVSDVHSAAFRAYLLETSKTEKLPVLFCSDATSNALDSQPPSAPATAIADRLEAAVRAALTTAPAGEPAVVVLCLSGTGTVMRRADRSLVLDDVSARMVSGRTMRATTPKEYLRRYRPTAEAYGYAPGSDVGGFDLWMGSANQMSLWNALADARKAAGGDTAVTNTTVREALLQAESGLWYLSLALPQPRYQFDESIARFRALVADIYRGAGKTAPAVIAPINLETPAPVGIPGK